MIHGLAGYDGSLLQRKLRGPVAVWDTEALLLRAILLAVQGGNWQRAGGKGSKPKPIPLPEKQGKRSDGAALARRLQNLGQIPDDVNI